MFEHKNIERYEFVWLAVAVVMVIALFTGVLQSLLSGTAPHLTAHHDHSLRRIDPNNLAATPFAQPGLQQGPNGELEAYVLAKAFTFEPRELRVPAHQQVTLYFTSSDVTHGVKIEGTNLNVQLLPGEVAAVKHTFTRPGRYLVGCSEYCGSGHHAMNTTLIVEETR